MAHAIGQQILNLQMPDRVGRMEFCDFIGFIQAVTGGEVPNADPLSCPSVFGKFFRWADYDFWWYNNDGPEEWSVLGRTTNMGHAEWAQGGTDYRRDAPSPFKTIDEVINFDALAEYGTFEVDERACYFQRCRTEGQAFFPDLIYPGGYYKTLISGCIATFGWEMFLDAVGTDPVRFGDYVLEGFFKLTELNLRAWAKTDIPFFISHDDMVWTEGAIFKPDWYRKYVFPRYQKLWQPLRERGIKVLFCSDGTFTEFVDDIAAAGADGFIFEPTTSLEYIAGKYGRTHILMGNADCRVLTFGKKADIEREVLRCMHYGKPCPGFVMLTSNHLPANIPMDNLYHYFDLVKKHGRR